MPKGCLVVIVGPSGVGKSSVVELLTDIFPRTARLVTTTSRPKRPHETDGLDYHFVSRQEFERQAADGQFMEFAEYAGNLYGSSLTVLEQLRREYMAVFAILDANGACAAKRLFPKARTVFLMPSGNELEERLMLRSGIDRRELEARLQKISEEIASAKRGDYNYLVVNVDGRIGRAVGDILRITLRSLHGRW